MRDINRNALFIPRRILNACRKTAEFTNIEYLKVNNIYYSATVCTLMLSAQIRQGINKNYAILVVIFVAKSIFQIIQTYTKIAVIYFNKFLFEK